MSELDSRRVPQDNMRRAQAKSTEETWKTYKTHEHYIAHVTI
jgi:hypothetical protein